MSENVLHVMRNFFSELSPSEKAACDYILKNPESVLYMTTKQLGKESLSSSTTIMRLCKKLGFNGFNSLKISLSADLEAYKQHIKTDNQCETNASDFIDQMISQHISSINATSNLIQENKVKTSLKYIDQASKVDFYGMGSSFIVCLDAQKKFMKLNKNTTAHEDPHLQWISAINLKENDVVLAVSYSGETKETIKGVTIAKTKGARVITITKFESNTLASLADIPFYVPKYESAYRKGAIISRSSQLLIIDILFSLYANQHDQESERGILNTLNAIGIPY